MVPMPQTYPLIARPMHPSPPERSSSLRPAGSCEPAETLHSRTTVICHHLTLTAACGHPRFYRESRRRRGAHLWLPLRPGGRIASTNRRSLLVIYSRKVGETFPEATQRIKNDQGSEVLDEPTPRRRLVGGSNWRHAAAASSRDAYNSGRVHGCDTASKRDRNIGQVGIGLPRSTTVARPTANFSEMNPMLEKLKERLKSPEDRKLFATTSRAIAWRPGFANCREMRDLVLPTRAMGDDRSARRGDTLRLQLGTHGGARSHQQQLSTVKSEPAAASKLAGG